MFVNEGKGIVSIVLPTLLPEQHITSTVQHTVSFTGIKWFNETGPFSVLVLKLFYACK